MTAKNGYKKCREIIKGHPFRFSRGVAKQGCLAQKSIPVTAVIFNIFRFRCGKIPEKVIFLLILRRFLCRTVYKSHNSNKNPIFSITDPLFLLLNEHDFQLGPFNNITNVLKSVNVFDFRYFFLISFEFVQIVLILIRNENNFFLYKNVRIKTKRNESGREYFFFISRNFRYTIFQFLC